jgi:hypothetical protein
VNFLVLESINNGMKFRIEEDYPCIGSYLYVFDGEKCVRDYLQNDIEMCKRIAFEEYEVPIEKWTVILEDRRES